MYAKCLLSNKFSVFLKCCFVMCIHLGASAPRCVLFCDVRAGFRSSQ